jgi:hypothetical protein
MSSSVKDIRTGGTRAAPATLPSLTIKLNVAMARSVGNTSTLQCFLTSLITGISLVWLNLKSPRPMIKTSETKKPRSLLHAEKKVRMYLIEFLDNYFIRLYFCGMGFCSMKVWIDKNHKCSVIIL